MAPWTVGRSNKRSIRFSRTKERSIRFLLLVFLIAPGVVAGLANLFDLPVDILSVILYAAAIVACNSLGWNETYKRGSFRVKALIVLAMLAAVFWMVAMMYAPRPTVLSLIGEEVPATVVAHEIIRYEDAEEWYFEHCYTVRRIDNGTVADGMCRDYDEFRLRDTIIVLMDPYGFMADSPEEVASARPFQVMGLVSLPFIVVPVWLTGDAPIRSQRKRRRRY